MLDEATPLPEAPRELKALARLLIGLGEGPGGADRAARAISWRATGRDLFGPLSESAGQLQLALEPSEVAAAAIMGRLRLPEDGLDKEPDAAATRPRRRPIPDHIPRMTVEILPGEDACAGCGGRLRRLGEDVTEELEYVPGRFVVNRMVRPRLACSGCERFVQAPLPSRPIERGPSSAAHRARPIERGRPGPGLRAHVLVAKYADHLPLCREGPDLRARGHRP